VESGAISTAPMKPRPIIRNPIMDRGLCIHTHTPAKQSAGMILAQHKLGPPNREETMRGRRLNPQIEISKAASIPSLQPLRVLAALQHVLERFGKKGRFPDRAPHTDNCCFLRTP
jgi:hypothetical protein